MDGWIGRAGSSMRTLAACGALLAGLAGCKPSADANRDGAVDADDLAEVERCLGADLEARPDCRGADVDRNGSVGERDLAIVARRLAALPLPALVASAPAHGEGNVAATAWLDLRFAAPWTDRADGNVLLRCDGVAQGLRRWQIEPARLALAPVAPLPHGAACELSWRGSLGTERLAFTVAAATAVPATALYDRGDPSRIAPFPDDFWLRDDASTRTGKRLAIPTPERDAEVAALFEALLHETAALDGWSPIAPIVVELSEAPDPASLPMTPAASLDPLASIGLFDVTPGSDAYGQRVPFQLHVRNDVLPGEDAAHSLVAFPSISLSPGGRYAFAVTRRARTAAGPPFEPTPFSAAALRAARPDDPPAVASVRRATADASIALAHAARPALAAGDLALLLSIQVRSTDTIPDDLLAMKEQMLAEPAPAVTVSSIDPGPTTGGFVVRGTWQAPNWRQGQFLARDAAGRPRIAARSTVPFVLALPSEASSGPVPVVMYQHGNPGSAGELQQAAVHLLAGGFAVAGFTDPLNREYADTAQQMLGLFGVLRLSGRVPALWTQAIGEQMAFLRALETLAQRDFLPRTAPDGVPELDLGRPLSYLGVSGGGMLGQGFLPYAPEIRAAVFATGPTRLSELLFQQDRTDPLGTGGLLDLVASQVPGVRAPEVWAGLSIFQTIHDAQEPQMQAPLLHREPIEVAGTRRKASLLVVEGLHDSFVPANSTRAFAWSAGVRDQIGRVAEAVPFFSPVSGSVRANVDADTTAAYVQYDCGAGSEGHYCAQEGSEPQQLAFFRSALDGGAPTLLAPDLDSDGDGIHDVRELQIGTDPQRSDTDGDGLSDGTELAVQLDPRNPADAAADRDGDGLSNAEELAHGTHLSSRDTDGDLLWDGDEVVRGTSPLVRDTDGGGRTDGEEVLTDATDPLDRADDQPLVSLPTTRVDGEGIAWPISAYGGVGGYSSGMTASASVPLVGVFASVTPTEDDGREIVFGPTSGQGLTLTRKLFVPRDAGFIRSLDIYENPGETPVATVYRSDVRASDPGQRAYLATSSGDAALDATDDWIAADDTDGARWPAVAVVFSGPGAAAEPVQLTRGVSSYDLLHWELPLVVPPRGRVAVLWFAAQRGTRAGAVAIAEALRTGSAPALAGLSSAERKAVVNFAVAPDADGDGLLDFDEIGLGTDPQNPDSDGDGLRDGFEVDLGTDPLGPGDAAQDPDGDGADNAAEQAAGTDPLRADTDGDGLSDGAEIALGTDPLRRDTDADGVSDAHEVEIGIDPLDADADADGDQLEDADEVLYHRTDPLRADTDGDGLLDGFELQVGLDPRTADADADDDRDGLSNVQELALGTDFWSFDTDLDGLGDGQEVAIGSSPLAFDTDAGGRPDFEEWTFDETDPTDAADDLSRIVGLVSWIDGGGFGWRTDWLASLSSAEGGPIASGATTWIREPYGSFWLDLLGRPGIRELLAPSYGFGLPGVSATQRIYVSPDAPFGRVLGTIHNASAEPAEVPVYIDFEFLYDPNQLFAVSSGGGSTPRVGDDWFVLDDAEGAGLLPTAVVFAGPGAPTAPVAVEFWWSHWLRVELRVAVPPRSRSSWVTYLVQANTREEAIAAAESLAALEGPALEGVSDAQRARIVNFDVPLTP